MMIDICLPVPFRVAMWIANSNLDKIQAKEMAEALIPIVTVEQAQAHIDYIRRMDPEKSAVERVQKGY